MSTKSENKQRDIQCRKCEQEGEARLSLYWRDGVGFCERHALEYNAKILAQWERISILNAEIGALSRTIQWIEGLASPDETYPPPN